MYKKVVYISKSSNDFSELDLKELLFTSRAKNKKNNITGVLLYKLDYFIQYIEGNAVLVKKLMEDIKKDNRHSNLKVLLDEDIPIRNFSNWDMLLNTHLDSLDDQQIQDLYQNPERDTLHSIIKTISLGKISLKN